MKNVFYLPEMERVEEHLEEYSRTSSEELNHLSSLLLKRKGKRLRPLLVILSSSFYPVREDLRIQVATAVELIHTASLIHDDIIDEASYRRGGETINAKWNNKMAVLTGDHLFARAFQLLTAYEGYPLLSVMTKTISLMCAGEIHQLTKSGHIPGEEEYLKQIEKKTASLLAASCYLGGIISSMPKEEAEKLYKYGLYLGFSFQIIDDIFDIKGSRGLGKPTGSDLQDGVFTLPFIYLLENEEYRPLVDQLLQKRGDTSLKTYIIKSLEKTRSLERAYQKALSFMELALDELEGLPLSPARDLLNELGSYVVEREY